MTLRIELRDLNPGMVTAWQEELSKYPGVSISQGNIFDGVPCDAIISPANSFGYMDGGIDLAYSQRFGWGLQERLQAKIKTEFHGELPVGCATIVPTGEDAIPWLISAPTMRVPDRISVTIKAYLAFRAALCAVEVHNRTAVNPIKSILCPGLGTATGRMPHARCAYQMHVALRTLDGSLPDLNSLRHVREGHVTMLCAK